MAAVFSPSSLPPDNQAGPTQLQVALALAVFRSKPDGVTARAYILQLRQHVRPGKQVFANTHDHDRYLDQATYWKARYDEAQQRCQELERRNIQLERWRLSDTENGLDVMIDEPRSRPGTPRLRTPRPRTPRPSTPRPSTPRPGTAGGSKRKAAASTPFRSLQRMMPSPSDAPDTQEHKRAHMATVLAVDEGEVDRATEKLLQTIHVTHKLCRQETLQAESLCFSLVETARAIGAVMATVPRHYDRVAMGNLKGNISMDKDRSEMSSMIRASSRAFQSLTFGLKKLSDSNGSHLPGLVIFECVKMFKTIIASLSDAAQQIACSRFYNQSQRSKDRMETNITPRETGPFRAVAQFLNAIISSLQRDDPHHREIFEGALFVLIERTGHLLFHSTFGHRRGATTEADINLSPATDDKGTVARQIVEVTAIRLEAQCLVTVLDRAMGLAPYHMNSALGSRPSSSANRRTPSAVRSSPARRLTPASSTPLVSRARDKLQRTLIQCMFGEEGHDEFADVLRMPGTLGPLPRVAKVDDNDVGDWFNGEVWRLIGWDLLDIDTKW